MKNPYFKIICLFLALSMLNIQLNAQTTLRDKEVEKSYDKIKNVCPDNSGSFSNNDISLTDQIQNYPIPPAIIDNITSHDTTKWLGIINQDWFNPLNWSDGVPDTSKIAMFETPVTDTLHINIINNYAYAYELFIDNTDTGFVAINIDDITLNYNAGLFVKKGITYKNNYKTVKECVAAIIVGSAVVITVAMLLLKKMNIYASADTTCEEIDRENDTPNECQKRDTVFIKYWSYKTPVLDSSLSSIFQHYILREWNEPLGKWVDVDPLSTGNILLERMKGYTAAYCTTDPDDTMHSVVEEGYLSYFDTLQRILTNSGGAYGGWNLIGNPYTCFINWDSVTIPLPMDATAFFWNTENQNYEFYTKGVGGTAPKYIKPGKGFFVYTLLNTIFKFEPFHDIWWPDPDYTKSEIISDNNRIILEVSAGNRYDDLIINFRNDATTGFDRLLDARKMFSSYSNVPQLFMTNDNVDFAMNSIPFTDSINISFKAGKSGDYTISLRANNTEANNVVLFDKQTSNYFNLSQNPDYAFYHSSDYVSNRFILFLRDKPFGIDPGKYPQDNPDYTIRSSGSEIIINSLNKQNIGSVAIFNILGQRLAENNLHYGLNNVEINCPSGYYIIRIIDQNSTVNKKVFKK